MGKKYVLLITGIPAAGKSSLAEAIQLKFCIPLISKDAIKEIMYDTIGFKSREEKVNLGLASANILYYLAENLMKTSQSFILENNFENATKKAILDLIEKYDYKAITVLLTGDYDTIYRRFIERNHSSDRHLGHVLNDCYPTDKKREDINDISLTDYINAVVSRGMDTFCAKDYLIKVDTTDFDKVDRKKVMKQIEEIIEK